MLLEDCYRCFLMLLILSVPAHHLQDVYCSSKVGWDNLKCGSCPYVDDIFPPIPNFYFFLSFAKDWKSCQNTRKVVLLEIQERNGISKLPTYLWSFLLSFLQRFLLLLILKGSCLFSCISFHHLDIIWCNIKFSSFSSSFLIVLKCMCVHVNLCSSVIWMFILLIFLFYFTISKAIDLYLKYLSSLIFS